jgi:acyl-CoA thioester hydrolase
MASEFRFRRRVEFSETDAAGIAHFSSFLLYAEQAEHALHRSFGNTVFKVPSSGEQQTITWPRVRIEADFQSAARFEDELDVIVQVGRLGTKSVTYAFRILHGDRLVATGKLTAVCCFMSHDRSLKSTSIPEPLRQQLEAYSIEPNDSKAT